MESPSGFGRRRRDRASLLSVVSIAVIAMLIVAAAQKRDEVARGGRADPRYGWIFCRVDQLIDVIGIEAAR